HTITHLFLLTHRPPPRSTLFPYTTLFRSDVTRSDDDYYALAVANSYLGEHRTFNGKLMQDLRGKRGLNYGDYSYIEDYVQEGDGDRKSTRLNSSHLGISYAVFCLKKKKKI